MRRTILITCLLGGLAAAQAAETVDLARVQRDPPKLPTLTSAKPLFGLFVFGERGEKRVWAVLDQADADAASAYTVLLLDLNGDGDLTQSGERFTAKAPPARPAGEVKSEFEIGRFQEPGTERAHTEFTITWRPHRVSYRMNWLGGRVTMGAFGSEPDQYGNFSGLPADAPVLVPGHDRPFQFQHWMSGKLKRGADTDFKVFVGNPGVGPGTFSCVDDKFLPHGESVIATLLFRDTSGVKHAVAFGLGRRC